MQFYRITVYVVNEKQENEWHSDRLNLRDESQLICEKCNQHSERLNDNGFLFLSNAFMNKLQIGLILREVMNVKDYIDSFIDSVSLKVTSVRIEETTFSTLRRMLNAAARCEYVIDAEDILRDFGLVELSSYYRGWLAYDENIISEKSKDAIYSSAGKFFTKDTFVEELNRIFKEEKKGTFIGHPVDYILKTDDEAITNGVTKLLIQALYAVGRLENKRYSTLHIKPGERFDKNCLSSLYKASGGGTIVIHLEVADAEDGDRAYGDVEVLEKICRTARMHRREVLTIFCLPRVCDNIKRKIFENMNGCTFVEIYEEQAYYDKAVEYLKAKAKANKLSPDKKLFSGIEEGVGYLTPELNAMFDEWYSKKLKNTVFKQYKDFESVDIAVSKEKPKGNAYDELKKMIGLDSAKKVIDQALDSYKALKLFKDKGITADLTANHMIFTGNPGTAKTTVARLFAKIMRENDIIEKGQIIEVGRGDLVGKYVGWTAPIIQKKFKEAAGGVLFIDEAYSLVDDRDGMFGDEAINTIVQEMENHRGEVIVIFAGYPDKMEGFLRKNPGLKSRIAHHVHFEDYKPAELCEIAKLIAGQKGVKLDETAMIKIREIMEQAVKEEDFGNGRFVRNVIEKAKMAHNSRLVHMDVEALTIEDVKRISAEDIEIPEVKYKEAKRFGFVV